MLLVVALHHGESLSPEQVATSTALSCNIAYAGLSLTQFVFLQPVVWGLLGIIALVKISVGELQSCWSVCFPPHTCATQIQSHTDPYEHRLSC